MTSPIVYDVNLESHEKNYCDIHPVIIESNMERAIARWKKRNIFKDNHLDLSGCKCIIYRVMVFFKYTNNKKNYF
jgi:hypothetical protein